MLIYTEKNYLATCHSQAAELTLVFTYWVRKMAWHLILIFLQSPGKRAGSNQIYLAGPHSCPSVEDHALFSTFHNTPKTHEL